MTTLFTLQYTLTETHVGGAGVAGPVDLPIVREAVTDLPMLPDTALKGVARSAAPKEQQQDLFGNSEGDPAAGKIVFTQAHLLLYPLRSLQRPYVYATSALLLARLDRLTRAMGGRPLLPKEEEWKKLLHDSPHARVTSTMGVKALTVEDTSYGSVQALTEVTNLGEVLKKWFPEEEAPTAARIARDLVVLPDADLLDIIRRAPPVRARIRLNEQGTTTGGGGNLWYEEMLPSDCLFWSLVFPASHAASDAALSTFEKTVVPKLRQTQIGAGATTGHGQILWWPAGGRK